ncbi:MAG: diguanylate cyclase [Clostridiales bacterium]|nr:diguanylate cyclase [Clostridiales bacterium]
MNIFILFTLIAVILSFALMVRVILKRSQDRSVYLIFLFGACFMYSFGYLLEITSTHVEAAFFGVRVSYIGLPAILPLTYLFLRDVYQKKRLRISHHILLFFIPFVSLLSVQLYPLVQLYYRDIEYISNGWISNCRVYPGILNHIGFGYTYFITLLCIYLILKDLLKGKKHRRQQDILFLIALLLPVASTIPYILSKSALRYDFTPMITSATMVILLYSVIFHNLLLVIPVAREQVLEEMSDAFIICSADDQFLYANQAGIALFPLLESLEAGDRMTGMAGIGDGQDEVRLEVQGQNRIFKVTHTIIDPDRKKSAYCILYHDITQKTEMIHKLQMRSTYDALTGILNRDSFLALNAQLSEDTSVSCALAMIDVDHFKKVNDTWGHAAGDQVLRQITALIQGYLREEDSFGRFGGEEFLMMFKNLQQPEAVSQAQGLCKLIEDSTFAYREQQLSMSISIGIAFSGKEQSISLDTLLRRADKALYAAKENGRNQVYLFRDDL